MTRRDARVMARDGIAVATPDRGDEWTMRLPAVVPAETAGHLPGRVWLTTATVEVPSDDDPARRDFELDAALVEAGYCRAAAWLPVGHGWMTSVRRWPGDAAPAWATALPDLLPMRPGRRGATALYVRPVGYMGTAEVTGEVAVEVVQERTTDSVTDTWGPVLVALDGESQGLTPSQARRVAAWLLDAAAVAEAANADGTAVTTHDTTPAGSAA